jgi:hypothetical protein
VRSTTSSPRPGLGALVYAGLDAVLPEAIAWRTLFAGPIARQVDAVRT